MYQLTGESFKARVFRDIEGADEETLKQWSDELRETVFQQPSIVSCTLAVLRTMEHIGLKPDYATGHSLGEISSLVAAKALDPVDALQIAALRAQAMNNASGKGTGGMAAIGLDSKELGAFLKENDIDLVISNFNSVRQNVVSGKTDEIDKVLTICGEKKIWARKLPVSHAFHSSLVAEAGDELRKTLQDIPMTDLSGAAIYSTSTGDLLQPETDLKDMLAKQITLPVRFVEAVQKISELKPDIWVEIGPGQVLSGLVQDILGPDKVETFPTDIKQEDEFLLLNRLIARTFTLGFPLKTDRIFDHRFVRPFDPYDYNPVLIVNPCERPVAELEKPLTLEGGISSDLLPASATPESYSAYLSQRNQFLKQIIEVDYNNWPGITGEQIPAVSETSKVSGADKESVGEEDGLGSADSEEIIDVVIDWIAKRTGYPKDFITPDKKLRDDLNLDSIKAGELALMLSQKMGRELPFDLGIVANASIEYLVETVAGFEGQRIGMDVTLDNRWIKDFAIDLLPAPIELEQPVEPSEAGITYVVGDSTSPRVQTIAGAVSTLGLQTEVITLQQAAAEDVPLEDVGGVIFVLPEETKHFYEIKPSEFKTRVEDFSNSLFTIMQKALAAVAENESFHCLVIRPAGANDPGSDFDGGAGFFKTLSLEHEKEKFIWKWLTVPAQLEEDDLADKVITELQHTGTRIEYHYNNSGARLSPTSVQVGASSKKAVRLGAIDTVLVSGGGKGITFEMAYALARKTRVKLGLLGSSPLPDQDDMDGELAKNLEKMRQNAVRHLYVQADVTNYGAVADAVKIIERKLGKISAVLHGAGISRFSEFVDMDLENYRRCIDIKAAGLYNIMQAVNLNRLKALHVISSVLGRTGMFRQADYTYANAWLDGATLSIARSFPKMHVFSVGYSVWEETGIGAKSGSLEMLQNVGVSPLSIKQGIDTYLKFALYKLPYNIYVCTGRLNPDVERRLNPSLDVPAWRFLESVKRFVPTVELLAEAKLTHERDRYIPEHVFSGTPLMPTVLGLEAMTEAAMACLGTEEVPVISNVRLKRPMIIPEDTGLTVRTMALAEAQEEKGTTVVNVIMRSESDGFANDHFEIDCIFGMEKPAVGEFPICPELPADPYPKSPESFAPSPLFQGRFFRRITKIFDIQPGEQTLTEITVPVNAQYYSNDFNQLTVTPTPAIRDTMLQAAGLMAPAGYLPESIERVLFLRKVKEGEKLVCWARAVSRADSELKADIMLFDYEGNAVEVMEGVVVQATSTEVDLAASRKTAAIELKTLNENLEKVIKDSRLSVGIMTESEAKVDELFNALTDKEKEEIEAQTNEVRRHTNLSNILAAKYTAIQYSRSYLNRDLLTASISLLHDKTGKPELSVDDVGCPTLQVSLADSNGISAAIVSDRAVGIDIEPVEERNTETWQGLLGVDGYDLAMHVQKETGELFDTCATRIWTLIESGKKANNLVRIIPEFANIINDVWLVFTHTETGGQWLSALCGYESSQIAVSIARNDLETEKEDKY
jgi:enediyne polyketide synthase